MASACFPQRFVRDAALHPSSALSHDLCPNPPRHPRPLPILPAAQVPPNSSHTSAIPAPSPRPCSPTSAPHPHAPAVPPSCPICALPAAAPCPSCDDLFCDAHTYRCPDCNNTFCGQCFDAHLADGHWSHSDTAAALASATSPRQLFTATDSLVSTLQTFSALFTAIVDQAIAASRATAKITKKIIARTIATGRSIATARSIAKPIASTIATLLSPGAQSHLTLQPEASL